MSGVGRPVRGDSRSPGVTKRKKDYTKIEMKGVRIVKKQERKEEVGWKRVEENTVVKQER